ncbi:LOW QUALITY PROTEIN: tRNA methyl transferase [Endogone sp. FLAS-F59071]|nr:LOW QUALITY PROTEIN: tRNA methyl transferase [Endogone sp. FLAS-F59071]|eukprot:RUS16335.1 LOW QUALITY PROTEIN: tRNA methyl transferase [Endogone sp. FLAS-F59071]
MARPLSASRRLFTSIPPPPLTSRPVFSNATFPLKNPEEPNHRSNTTSSRGPLPGDNVILAMSGGVDSSVSALLLQRQGFAVEGVYMRNWDTADEHGVCTSEEDWRDVREVCGQLGLPCRRVDFTKQYWTHVFEKTLEDYTRGITPNPDVMCNREIKFGAMLERCLGSGGGAEEAGAKKAWLATGHYARIEREADGRAKLLRGEERILACLDRNKDQSYYLSSVPEAALQRTLFPLGHLPKQQVKAIARDSGLDRVADKRESMGICFVGKRKRFADFLAEYIDQPPGPAVTPEGKVIGQHKGLFAYTIGQASRIYNGTERWFVLRLCNQHARRRFRNVSTILITPFTNGFFVNNYTTLRSCSTNPLLFKTDLYARDWIWIHDIPPPAAEEAGLRAEAQVRYRQKAVGCTVKSSPDGDGHYYVTFDEPIRAIAPGQNIVVWSGDWCLGGGVIDRVVE